MDYDDHFEVCDDCLKTLDKLINEDIWLEPLDKVVCEDCCIKGKYLKKRLPGRERSKGWFPPKWSLLL